MDMVTSGTQHKYLHLSLKFNASTIVFTGPDSTPSSPEKGSHFDLTRSKSVPYSPVSALGKSGIYNFRNQSLTIILKLYLIR